MCPDDIYLVLEAPEASGKVWTDCSGVEDAVAVNGLAFFDFFGVFDFYGRGLC